MMNLRAVVLRAGQLPNEGLRSDRQQRRRGGDPEGGVRGRAPVLRRLVVVDAADSVVGYWFLPFRSGL
jgi:hypothetical protein